MRIAKIRLIGPGTFHLALCLSLCLLLWQQALAQDEVPLESIDSLSAEVSDRVVAWRRDFHQNPELSNREFRTAGIVAEHLAGLGMEVQTGVAHTGVVGLLRGGKPGPVVLLRADMDGLPVAERNDLPFRSTAIGEYNGEEVPVMHACGHDSHVAILMGVAASPPGRATPAWTTSRSWCTGSRPTAPPRGWVSTAWSCPPRSSTPCKPSSAATWS